MLNSVKYWMTLKSTQFITTCIGFFQNNDKLPWIETLENQVSRGKIIPVKLGALSVLEAKLSAAQTWLDSTRKAFIFKKSSSTLLEVRWQWHALVCVVMFRLV